MASSPSPGRTHKGGRAVNARPCCRQLYVDGLCGRWIVPFIAFDVCLYLIRAITQRVDKHFRRYVPRLNVQLTFDGAGFVVQPCRFEKYNRFGRDGVGHYFGEVIPERPTLFELVVIRHFTTPPAIVVIDVDAFSRPPDRRRLTSTAMHSGRRPLRRRALCNPSGKRNVTKLVHPSGKWLRISNSRNACRLDLAPNSGRRGLRRYSATNAQGSDILSVRLIPLARRSFRPRAGRAQTGAQIVGLLWVAAPRAALDVIADVFGNRFRAHQTQRSADRHFVPLSALHLVVWSLLPVNENRVFTQNTCRSVHFVSDLPNWGNDGFNPRSVEGKGNAAGTVTESPGRTPPTQTVLLPGLLTNVRSDSSRSRRSVVLGVPGRASSSRSDIVRHAVKTREPAGESPAGYRYAAVRLPTEPSLLPDCTRFTVATPTGRHTTEPLLIRPYQHADPKGSTHLA